MRFYRRAIIEALAAALAVRPRTDELSGFGTRVFFQAGRSKALRADAGITLIGGTARHGWPPAVCPG